MLPPAMALLGAARSTGHILEGVRLLRLAVSEADRIGCYFLQPQRLVMLADALLLANRPGEATRVIAKATALAEKQGERGAAAAAHLVRARLLAMAGEKKEALVAARQASTAANTLEMQPLARQATAFAEELAAGR
jgi:hypothetical protein